MVLDLEELLEAAHGDRVHYFEFRRLRAAWRASPTSARQGFRRLRSWLSENGLRFERVREDIEHRDSRDYWIIFDRDGLEALVRRHRVPTRAPSRPSVTTGDARRHGERRGEIAVTVLSVPVLEVKRVG